MKSTAIIIPAYNEELTIRETIVDFAKHLPEAEIYVIDNASNDKTPQIARDELSRLATKGVVLFETRKGKGNAIRKAFREINADIYIVVDGDTTYPAADVRKLLEPVQTGQADLVVGDRLANGRYANENKRMFHEIGNKVVKWLINLLFSSSLSDIMSGYRVLNRVFVKTFPVLSEGFEIETEMTLHALDKRFRIVEIPIEYRDRPVGSLSKLNTVRDGLKVLKTIGWIFKDYKPLLFFGCLTFIFASCGLLAGMSPLIEYAHTHYVSHIPLAILATGLMIFSLLLLACGLILSSIVKINLQNFELKLNEYHMH